jgi:hypothetical protein
MDFEASDTINLPCILKNKNCRFKYCKHEITKFINLTFVLHGEGGGFESKGEGIIINAFWPTNKGQSLRSRIEGIDSNSFLL